ncbi:MAG: hypothetical protein QMD09_09760 [Desulfatibacillaceae bacterium]|nr:hypothetical protein [Desulfatibacillaceae bacterium]
MCKRIFFVALVVIFGGFVAANCIAAEKKAPAKGKAAPVSAEQKAVDEEKALQAKLEKESKAAQDLNSTAVAALDVLSKSALALDNARMQLVGTASLTQAQQLAELGVEKGAFFAALDNFGKALAAQEKAPQVMGNEIAACRKAVDAYLATKALSQNDALARIKKEDAKTAADIEQLADPELTGLILGLKVSKWLSEEAEAALACNLKLQQKISPIAQQANLAALSLGNELFISQQRAQAAAQALTPAGQPAQ